jgi:predicted phosphodiesterase
MFIKLKRIKKRGPIFLLLIVALATFALLPQLPIPLCGNADYPVFQNKPKISGGKIIFVSDTQEPIWIERFWLKKNRNIEARNLICNEIVKENPTAVVHLGDIVAFGYKETSWDPIDSCLYKLKRKGIRFYPTLGNHEEMIFSSTGEKKFSQRFPFFSKTGYTVKAGNIKIILLNSNFSDMTKDEIDKQQHMYKDELKTAEHDTTINFVIVATHYSPFTNSKIVSPSKKVQEFFVPPFLKSKKAKLFLSGHAHAFEHFKHGGKDFLVIGGGGGLQQPLLTGIDERWKDFYDSKSSKRMFHFLQCATIEDTIIINVNMINKAFTGFYKTYELKFPLK